jgi:hypothetical protein
MSTIDETSPHRLFAAIVLMGTGLALGCGGVSTSSREETGGGPSTGGGNGASGSGTSTSTSGTSAGAGGPILLPNGGSEPGISVPPTPAPVKPGPFACPPQQWTCAKSECGLVASGWALQDDCECDETRPRVAADCQEGKVFVCLEGTSTSDGRPLTETVPMSCKCVDKSMYFCSNECDLAYGQSDLTCQGDESQLSALCGCAVVYLK